MSISGSNHTKVLTYPEVISGKANSGKSVAIIGAGGIGFDTVEFLAHPTSKSLDYYQTWGVDLNYKTNGGTLLVDNL